MRFVFALLVLLITFCLLQAGDKHNHKARAAWAWASATCPCADCKCTGTDCLQGKCPTVASQPTDAPKAIETVSTSPSSACSNGSCATGTCSSGSCGGSSRGFSLFRRR